MGRHSAPDDDDEDEGFLAAQLAAGATAPTIAVPAAPPVAHGTNADLQLLRTSPALRARCIASVIVPFALYVALLAVVGNIGQFLLWMWVPTIIAGVLVGVFLDLAHRRHDPQLHSG